MILTLGFDKPGGGGSVDMSLVRNINKRKKAGTSRSKKNSTVSKKAYAAMKRGWKKKPTKKRRK